MAENMTAIRAAESMVVGTGAQVRGRMPRTVGYGAAMAVLAVALIGGIALHNRGASHPAVSAPRGATSAETRFIENNTTNLPSAVSAPVAAPVSQQRFLESNTTDLPNAVSGPAIITSNQQRFLESNTTDLPAASGPAVVTSAQQRFLESNTTDLPAASGPAVVPFLQQRFIEVNTVLGVGPAGAYTEDLTPLAGHPR